jgi:hypothetical protein
MYNNIDYNFNECVVNKLKQQYKLLNVPKWLRNEPQKISYSDVLRNESHCLRYNNVNKNAILNMCNRSNNSNNNYNIKQIIDNNAAYGRRVKVVVSRNDCNNEDDCNDDDNDDNIDWNKYVFPQTAKLYYDKLANTLNKEYLNIKNCGLILNIKNHTLKQIFDTISNPKLLYELYDYYPDNDEDDSTTHSNILHVWDFDSTHKVFIHESRESCPYHNTYIVTITLCEPEQYYNEIKNQINLDAY